MCLYNLKFLPSVHPLSVLHILHRVAGKLEPIPGDSGHKTGDILEYSLNLKCTDLTLHVFSGVLELGRIEVVFHGLNLCARVQIQFTDIQVQKIEVQFQSI